MKTKTQNSSSCPSLFILIITVLCSFHTSFVSAHKCLDDQKSLLLDLKHNLTFFEDASDKLEGWNQSTDCCMWSGVECDNSNGRVIGLDLSDKDISDGINNSCSLFRLRFLQRLNLAGYGRIEMVGNIPSAIGNLSTLTYLNLSDTGFTRQVPIEISQLVKLTVLDISQEYNIGLLMEKPNLATIIQNMSNMRELYLDRVDNSAMGNKWCQVLSSSLPQLQVLSMGDCGLRGKIHKSLSNLKHLSVINLDYNHMYGWSLPEFLAEFTNLTRLSLFDTRLVGTMPWKIFQIPTLRYLDLGYNSLQGTLPIFLKNGCLEELLLSNTQFSGILPSSISNLKKLRTLDLSNCRFKGSIPSSMESLNLLEEVSLSRNKFSGSIPSFSSMKNLTILDLRQNSLSGSINGTNWGKLINLTILDLSQNSLSGSINGTNWGKLINLKELHLAYNSLDGSIPKSLFSNPSLQYVDLYSNKFSGIDKFASMPFSQLRELVLGNNSLEGSIPNSIFQLRKLETLFLSSNKLNGTLKLAGFLLNFKNLSVLDLSFNSLSIDLDGCNVNSSFPQLRVLNLASCNLRAIDPEFINYISDVKFLSFSNNNLGGSIPLMFCNASSIQLLYLEHNHFFGKIPDCLIQNTKLSVLNLRGNKKLSGLIPDQFSRNCSLESLYLNDNTLQGRIPRSLANCKELKVLDVGDNLMNDTFPCRLKILSKLQVLILRSNKLHGQIVCSGNHSDWKMLQVVDLAFNHFSGEITSEILLKWTSMMIGENNMKRESSFIYNEGFSYYKNSVTITLKGQRREIQNNLALYISIDFSNNAFHGELPRELGNLNALKLLNLSHNYFSGSIPSSIGNLSEIESLDLSLNTFSGRIPAQLAKLNFLAYLNMSFNKLHGKIPTGTQLQSFDASSYIGNRLFGPPLTSFSKGKPGTTSSMTSSKGSNWNSKSALEWMWMGAEVGFPVGITIFIGPLLYIKRWRQWYCRLLYKLVMKILRKEDHARGRRNRRTGRQRQRR